MTYDMANQLSEQLLARLSAPSLVHVVAQSLAETSAVIHVSDRFSGVLAKL